ncbi:uncharacterized protein LOC122502809 isoform X2 [Leptopilina heterotoma]|uniref:uncharacterized protein LOC122502809 isoform X2 n=1 Tax=Leptopilina heterotoma TaxID=63436 RepID=UPI001CA88505|nr:uncharacterized protein LOC122502809 isoform X2 [Leptopilina heterotoma]
MNRNHQQENLTPNLKMINSEIPFPSTSSIFQFYNTKEVSNDLTREGPYSQINGPVAKEIRATPSDSLTNYHIENVQIQNLITKGRFDLMELTTSTFPSLNAKGTVLI